MHQFSLLDDTEDLVPTCPGVEHNVPIIYLCNWKRWMLCDSDPGGYSLRVSFWKETIPMVGLNIGKK